MVSREFAYKIFNQMSAAAARELVNFTKNQPLDVQQKADRTVVTACDKHIDDVLKPIAEAHGFAVVSEESETEMAILHSGNYLIIDDIDGTLAYIEHVNAALKRGERSPFGNLGPEWDYTLLLGIVENSRPRFGMCYNYVTGEKIFLDAEGPQFTIREGKSRSYPGNIVQFLEARTDDPVNARISADPGVDAHYKMASLGLRGVLAQINGYSSSSVVHFAQQNGLYDIMPAAVAAEWSGARLLDGNGKQIICNDYLMIPGGVAILTGDHFTWIEREL